MSKLLINKTVNRRDLPTHKATFTYADLSSQTSGTATLYIDTISAGDVVRDAWIVATTQFNGTSLTSCKVSFGDGVSTSNYINAVDVGPQLGINQWQRGAGANVNGYTYTSTNVPANTTSGLTVTIAATGTYASNITSGSFDIYYQHFGQGTFQQPLSTLGTGTNEFFW